MWWTRKQELCFLVKSGNSIGVQEQINSQWLPVTMKAFFLASLTTTEKIPYIMQHQRATTWRARGTDVIQQVIPRPRKKHDATCCTAWSKGVPSSPKTVCTACEDAGATRATMIGVSMSAQNVFRWQGSLAQNGFHFQDKQVYPLRGGYEWMKLQYLKWQTRADFVGTDSNSILRRPYIYWIL